MGGGRCADGQLCIFSAASGKVKHATRISGATDAFRQRSDSAATNRHGDDDEARTEMKSFKGPRATQMFYKLPDVSAEGGNAIYCVAFHESSSGVLLLAAGSESGELSFIDVASGEHSHKHKTIPHNSAVLSVDICMDMYIDMCIDMCIDMRV